MGGSDIHNKTLCELFSSITIHISIQPEVTPPSLRKLIHDLASSTNAFNFLVDEIAFDTEQNSINMERQKLIQLSEHASLNRLWIKRLCKSLSLHLA